MSDFINCKNPHDYTIRIRFGTYGSEDCYMAEVLEFPDVAEFANTADEAYRLAVDTIEATIEIFQESGRQIPFPENPIPDGLNPAHVGGDFNDFLKERGIFDEVDKLARERLEKIKNDKKRKT